MKSAWVLPIVVHLVLLILIDAAFNEVPVSQEVPVGTEAVFRCQHSTANAIGWKLNNSFVGATLPPGILSETTTENGNRVDTLTITARPNFNGTTIQCVAYLAGPPETSEPPAILLVVQGDVNPTDSTAGDFLTSPLSINVTVGIETMFHCEHPTAVGFGWLINGTGLNSQPDLHNTFIEGTNGSIRTLTVTALSLYNSTMIECIAFFSNYQPRKTTPPALLLVQGPLDAVSLTKVDLTISWEPPFSLNLTNIDPDIVYCVDVYNITCGGRDLVSSDCSVTDTNYTSLSDGYLYEYSVTPRSNVEGAENGTESYLRDALPVFAPSSTISSSDSLSNYQIELVYIPAFPIPSSSYNLSLEALDGLRDLDHVEVTATEIQSTLLLNVTGLESRRLWSATVLAFGCEEHSILSTLLSTHDFQNISISSPSAGVVRVTGRFVEGSPATGVLVIVSGDSGDHYHISTRDSSDSHTVTIPGLAGGEYTVSVFVVEENGLPFERAAIMPEHLSVETNIVESPSPTIEYSIQSTSTGVCVQCNFLDTDASECIAVVHDRDLMNIESSHKLTRSGNTASGCIEGVNLEDYQVGVVGGRQLNSGPAHSSNLTVIIAVLVPTVATLALIVVLSVNAVYCLKCRKHHGPGNVEKTQNIYTEHTCVPASPTENPRVPLVFPSVERSVQLGIYDSGDASRTSTLVGISAERNGISPLYSQVDVKLHQVSVPPVDDKPVVYAKVMKTQGANDQLYAMVNLKKSMCTRENYRDDLRKVDYSEILPHVVKSPLTAKRAESIPTDKSDMLLRVYTNESAHTHTHTRCDDATSLPPVPPPPPFTADSVVAALLPVASKWRAIGEAFPLSEKRLEDIETTERDEQCLQEMVEAYMLNGDLNHTWDEIVDVLKKIGEDSLAEKIFNMHVAPYVLTLPNQPQHPERGMYTPTHVSKHLTRNVSTDDGSLDTSSPGPSSQQTEPATFVSSEEEVEQNKEESLPTAGDAVLEMLLYDDDEGFNSYRLRYNRPKRRIAVDGDNTEMENHVETPDEVKEVKCESDESDSGVSDDLPSPTVDDDIPSYASDREREFSGVSCESENEDTSQPAGRTGPPAVQVATLDSDCIPQRQLMEETYDLVLLPPQCAVEEVSTCFQEEEPHDALPTCSISSESSLANSQSNCQIELSYTDKLYAMVNPKKSTCTRETYPDDLTKVVYSEIRPSWVELPPQATTVKIAPTAPTQTPFTTNHVAAALLPVASKWQTIGEAFLLSEKRLDDIETTEGDKQCLREMIEAYMLNSDLSHTWEEIVNVLKNEKVNEDTLAEKIYVMHVAPYVLTLPNQPQLPERGVYTHGSKLLTRNLSTDDGSLDTASPALSGQQTESVTSVSSEGEVKPDKEESLPTPGDAVLEMPPYDDGEGFNGCRSHRTRPKGRVTVDGDSIDIESDLYVSPHTGEDAISSSESKVDAQEVKHDSDESSKERVATDGGSGVSEGQEISLLLERDDVPSQFADADTSAEIVLSEEDYDSQIHLPSSSQCGKPSDASSSLVKGSFVAPERAGTQVNNGQSDDTSQPAGRTGPPITQVATPLQDTYILKLKLMEHTIASDLVPVPSPRATEEASSASQDREPHENYFAALAHLFGKVYVPRETDHPLGQVELTPTEFPNKPLKITEYDGDQTACIPVHSAIAKQMFPMRKSMNCAKNGSDEETMDPPNNKSSNAFITYERYSPYFYLSPEKHVDRNCLKRTSTDDLQHTCSYLPGKYVQSRAFAKWTNTQSCGLQATINDVII